MTWSWPIFLTYLADPRFVLAALVTLGVAVAAQGIGLAVGTLVALANLSGRRLLRVVGTTYVWILRGLPPLIILVLLYFGLPQLGLRLTVLQAGLLGLGAYAGAYVAEIVRAAILSVDPGQVDAARSLGLGYWTRLRDVVLPQAVRVALPPFGNEFASMLRTTSLLSVISFEELLRVTTLAINDVFRPAELYAVAAVYYLAMTTAWMGVQALLERRFETGVVARAAGVPLAAAGA